MPTFTKKLLNYISAVSLFAVSGATIGISTWLYDDNSGGNFSNWDSVCSSYPTAYLRPFSLTLSGANSPSYCGYSEENTTLRLTVACFTAAYSLLYVFQVVDQYPESFNTLLLMVLLFWGATVVMDSSTLNNSTAACEDSFEEYDGIECDSSGYGIMIAVTASSTVIITLLWYLQGTFKATPNDPLQAPLNPTDPTFSSGYYTDGANSSPAPVPTPLVSPSDTSDDNTSTYRAPSTTIYA